MTASLPHGLTDCLLWSDELGMGFHPRPPMDYSGPYFEKYQALDATPMGAALTAARVDMVRRHFDGEVLDVGIGGGRFVIESGGNGFDVNEEAVQWLKSRNAYADPYKGVAAITCWDSLEHVPDPEALVRSVGEWVFVSMPVYKDQADCLKSKHFKPGEHLHYWSVRGLVGWFAKMNFGCVEINERESDLGREGITSFAFRRFHG
ncbi:TPA: methyltransferase domain-containing protein [Pseudomonas aeruginosa]|nr:methyltransferase domain-containing protein [Pseudomonas aeruginosa]